MSPRFSVVVPYMSDGGRRDLIWAWNRERWTRLFPDIELLEGQSDEGSRSKARNHAASFATSDVLVIADSDTVPIPAFVNFAVDKCRDSGGWVIAYDMNKYYNLNRLHSDRYISRSPMTSVAEPMTGTWDHKITSYAGMLVVPRAAYEDVGGYDEKFIGWGYEDNAFAAKMDTLNRPHQRVSGGYAVHLWHEAPETACFGQPNIEHNRRLYRKYDAARGNQRKMRELV